MKKAFTYPFIFLITFFFTDLKSQTLKQSSGAGTDPEVKQAAIKANQRRIEKRKTQKNDITIPAKVNPIDENDIYEGRKAEFLGNLTVSELPADFPTYDKSYGMKY